METQCTWGLKCKSTKKNLEQRIVKTYRFNKCELIHNTISCYNHNKERRSLQIDFQKSTILKASLFFINTASLLLHFLLFSKIVWTLYMLFLVVKIFHCFFDPSRTGHQGSTVKPVQHLNTYYCAQSIKLLDERDTSTLLTGMFHNRKTGAIQIFHPIAHFRQKLCK